MAENEFLPEEPADFKAEYVRLRTMLDSLQLTSMRYFLKDQDEAGRIARAKELEEALKPVINRFQERPTSTPAPVGFMSMSKGADSGSGCPDGYFNCNGCCVAYPCP